MAGLEELLNRAKRLRVDHKSGDKKKSSKKAVFKFKPFSSKQKRVLTWWFPNSPVAHMDGIIADGAIRSGKTVSMCLSFAIFTFHNG